LCTTSRFIEDLPERRNLHQNRSQLEPIAEVTDNEEAAFWEQFKLVEPEQVVTDVQETGELEVISPDALALAEYLEREEQTLDTADSEEDVPIPVRTEEEEARNREIRRQQVVDYYRRLIEEDLVILEGYEARVHRATINTHISQRKVQQTQQRSSWIPLLKRKPRRR
jgi:hypothetical protein